MITAFSHHYLYCRTEASKPDKKLVSQLKAHERNVESSQEKPKFQKETKLSSM